MLTVVAIVTMIVSGIGFVAALLLNAFVFDEFDAYGEVPIPGSGTVHLPAGEATVSLHTLVIGDGGAVPVPKMSIGVQPPAGVSDPVLTEDIGGTTTVNNDAHIRVWRAQIPADGDYRITTDGNVGAYVNPTLAFGHDTRYGQVPWVLAGVFVLAGVDLVIARVWASRSRRPAPRRPGPDHFAPSPEPFVPPSGSSGPAPDRFVPTDEAVRIEQLNNLARLRDSGALTEAEFKAEKKRLLQGY